MKKMAYPVYFLINLWAIGRSDPDFLMWRKQGSWICTWKSQYEITSWRSNCKQAKSFEIDATLWTSSFEVNCIKPWGWQHEASLSVLMSECYRSKHIIFFLGAYSVSHREMKSLCGGSVSVNVALICGVSSKVGFLMQELPFGSTNYCSDVVLWSQ